jgi:hypothetical protein
MNKRERLFVIGGIVLIVAAAAIAAVVSWALTKGGGGTKEPSSVSIIRRTPLTSGRERVGQGPPPEVSRDVQAILDAKNAVGKDHIPGVPPGQQAPRVDQNPSQTCDPNLEPNAYAEWKDTPKSLREAGSSSDQTVVGTVVSVAAGDPYKAAADGLPGGSVETPTQNITIRIDRSVKGNAKGGQQITVQRLGDAQGCYRVGGDPAYQQGQQVLLLLQRGSGGKPSHPLGAAGRYTVGADNSVQALEDNPIASEVAGKKLDDVVAMLQGH